jgi:hypothetical protein
MAQRKVQSTQLSDTGVVPGPYTSANLTVDASGRITSAANGSSGSVSAPLNQIVYGTGPGVTSDPDLTFNSATDTLSVGAAANGAITAATGFSISLESDGGTYEITLKSTGDVRLNGSTGTSGQVLTSAGSGTPAYWSTPTGGAQSLLTTTVTFN